jgi:Fur family transcriptional regulator, ferric uptake regulator
MAPVRVHHDHAPAPATALRMRELREAGDAAAALLRRAGCRPTPQRLLILQSLGAGDHVTAEDVLAHVRAASPAVNASTVYRTLEALRAAGLVRQTDLGGSRLHYELVREHRHHHAVCERCGAVAHVHDAALAPLARALEAATGFRLTTEREIAIPGLCPACRTHTSTSEVSHARP